MNTMLFLDRCREVLPPAKDLTPPQWAAYREKVDPFTDEQRAKLYDSVIETCKFFPKIADIFECARNLGFFAKEQTYKPHMWTPTSCQLCGGSGLLAAFYSQEFEFDGGVKFQILRLHYAYPYHESGEYQARKDHDDIRTVRRCSCSAGTVETLDKGIPRWRQDEPQTLRRSWAS